MPQRLVTVDDPQQIQTGIVKSLHKLQVPVWIDGENVVFEDGAVRKSPGYAAVCTPTGTDPVTGLLATPGNVEGVTPSLVWGDIGNLYRFNNGALTTDGTGYSGKIDHDIIQPFIYQIAHLTYLDIFQDIISFVPGIWSLENYGTWAIATNGADKPQINKMTGAGFINIPVLGVPPLTAAIAVRFADQLLLFNCTGNLFDGTISDGSFVVFSDIDNPEVFNSGAAGYLPIRDMGSDIQAACRLGSYVGVYSDDSMALVASLGAPLYFGAQKIFDGIGSPSKHAVVPVGFVNYGISKKGVWQTDGTQYHYVSPPFLRKWMEANVNFSGYGYNIAGFVNEDRSLIEWGVTTHASMNSINDVTIGYNYDTGAWTFRDYGITAGDQKGIFDFPAFGLGNGGVFWGNTGVDAAGSAVHAWVQSKPFPCLAPNMSPFAPKNPLEWKILDMAILAIKDLEGVANIYFGWQADLDDAITWSAAYQLDQESQPIFPTEKIEGKYFSIKIESTTIGADWTFSGMELFGSYNGAEF